MSDINYNYNGIEKRNSFYNRNKIKLFGCWFDEDFTKFPKCDAQQRFCFLIILGLSWVCFISLLNK